MHKKNVNKNKVLDESNETLGKKIQAVKAEIEGKSSSEQVCDQAKGLALGFRIITELVSGIIIGGGIGYLLDSLFHTHKVLIFVFIFFGGIAGMYNVYRFSEQCDKEATKQ